LIDIEQIYDFALKWLDKFQDQSIAATELFDTQMADECAYIGFKPDNSNIFSKRYGQATFDHEALSKVINEVVDVPLLGSALYSRCLYFNHTALPSEIQKPESRMWFVCALTRIAYLTKNFSYYFHGTPEKLRLFSDNLCYGFMPGPEVEIMQYLTISADGHIWFSGYCRGNADKKHRRTRSMSFKIPKSDAEFLLNNIAEYFRIPRDFSAATDVGEWKMKLTNTDGQPYKYFCSMWEDLYLDGIGLSSLIRDVLGMNSLFVFDGIAQPDVINRITVDYRRNTKIKQRNTSEYKTQNYSEQLTIDRESETVEHIQNTDSLCKIFHKYEVHGGIESLLEKFNPDTLFTKVIGNPEDAVEVPYETKDYTITIDYREHPQRVITGTYDKNGLPDDFDYFAETVLGFMCSYGLGEILDHTIYSKVKRGRWEYIFCSLVFDNGYKSYYYLTYDDSIAVGDFVIVPAGKENNLKVAKVVKIEYFTKENAPFPIEKTKCIIRRCSKNELNDL
jgi:hypothetical protein